MGKHLPPTPLERLAASGIDKASIWGAGVPVPVAVAITEATFLAGREHSAFCAALSERTAAVCRCRQETLLEAVVSCILPAGATV